MLISWSSVKPLLANPQIEAFHLQCFPTTHLFVVGHHKFWPQRKDCDATCLYCMSQMFSPCFAAQRLCRSAPCVCLLINIAFFFSFLIWFCKYSISNDWSIKSIDIYIWESISEHKIWCQWHQHFRLCRSAHRSSRRNGCLVTAYSVLFFFFNLIGGVEWGEHLKTCRIIALEDQIRPPLPYGVCTGKLMNCCCNFMYCMDMQTLFLQSFLWNGYIILSNGLWTTHEYHYVTARR